MRARTGAMGENISVIDRDSGASVAVLKVRLAGSSAASVCDDETARNKSRKPVLTAEMRTAKNSN